jgi:medium-chain acyl-[acyl-carrier-protein] hydrolase
MRLFCFPYEGGSAAAFQAWGRNLGAEFEVCAVEPPGRGARLHEPAFESMGPLAGASAAALKTRLDKPFALYGHGSGALAAFEAARLLRRDGGPQPSALFVGACRAPQLPDASRRTYDLPDAEFVEELRRPNGTPEEVLQNAEVMEVLLPRLRADLALAQTYSYEDEPPLACPVVAFGGEQDTEVSREQLEAWGAQTAGAFTLRMLPCDHFFINTCQALFLRSLSEDLRGLVGADV